LYWTAWAGAGEVVAAFVTTEITSFEKLLLKKSSGGVDAAAGGLEEVADRVGTQG
jgi:hypothetical protein